MIKESSFQDEVAHLLAEHNGNAIPYHEIKAVLEEFDKGLAQGGFRCFVAETEGKSYILDVVNTCETHRHPPISLLSHKDGVHLSWEGEHYEAETVEDLKSLLLKYTKVVFSRKLKPGYFT